jgi:hypothetical protein
MGVKGGRRVGLTTLTPSVSRLSRQNVGPSTSHNPIVLHGLLQGKLYLLHTQCVYVFRMILTIRVIISLNSINRLVFVMRADCVFVRKVTYYADELEFLQPRITQSV